MLVYTTRSQWCRMRSRRFSTTKSALSPTRRLPTRYSVYLLYWCKSTNTDTCSRPQLMRGICRLAVDVEKGYNGAPQVTLLALQVHKYRYCLCAASVAWLCTLHFLTGRFFFLQRSPSGECAQFTGFTCTKVQILTAEARRFFFLAGH